MDVAVVSLAERPDLAGAMDDFPGAWAPFLYQDPVTVALYDLVTTVDPRFCLLAVDPADPTRPVAKACTLPVSWPDGWLPDNGYDGALLTAAADRLAGRRARRVCAVEIAVQIDRRGAGFSAIMLAAARRNAADLGHTELIAPVRPNRKHEYPDMPMADYVAWTRDDGLPVDPWLRVHVRAGAEIVAIAPCSMTITGSLAEWRAWTGLPFDAPGPVHVPQALVPVHCDLGADRAVYVEPNVWVRHRL